jgi:FAD/FMN-containing dehydrogenase/ferredoxin
MPSEIERALQRLSRAGERRDVVKGRPQPSVPGGRRPDIDREELAAALRDAIEGEVRFSAGDRALYATDGSNYRHVPIGVVIPRTIDDVVRTKAVARRFGGPILARGAGTSLAGQCTNIAVVIDFLKNLNRIFEIDEAGRRVRVQPGCVLDIMRDATEAHGLTFGPDPATHEYCTIGGMIGNNACGAHSVMAEFYGPGARMEDNVEELEVLTYDGLRMRVGPTPEHEIERIISEGGRRGETYRRLRDLRDRHGNLIRQRFPKIPRRVSGYNLPELLPERGFNLARALVGSESTCVTILEATLTLLPNSPKRSLLVLGYPSVYEAGDHVSEIRERRPVAIEGVDDVLVEYVRKKDLETEYLELLPEGKGWLVVEFGGDTQEEATGKARDAMEALRRGPRPPAMRVYEKGEEQTKVWEIRESGLGATAFVPGEPATWEGWEDSAVPPERVGEYLRDFRDLLERHQYRTALYGHFGQGCVHCRIDFDFKSAEGIERFRRFTQEAAHLVVDKYGGSLSGEHGDGQARGDLLPIMYGQEMVEVFREFKQIWDPDGLMNPGKIVDAQQRSESLRLGVHYRPPQSATHFKFPEDGGSFAAASLCCVGVGKCLRLDSGTMCPSYMVLREEKHTTRGRAHLLFEMMRGDVVRGGWADEEVKESLDLCLACKGCKGDCPVNVDVATYKAEFLSHCYERHFRPREAYAFGLIPWWARLASIAPLAANFFTHAPVIDRIAKFAAHMTQER